MRLWRITDERWLATAFSGVGASVYPGRWNHEGTLMVYASESMALAVLEVVAHLGPAAMPRPYAAIEAELPDEYVGHFDVTRLTSGWESMMATTRQAGQAWVAAGASVALVVPSVLPGAGAPAGNNVLLNPAHPRFSELRVLVTRRFQLDERLILRDPKP